MTSPATSSSLPVPRSDRLVLLVRRAAAWIVDGLVLTLPLLAVAVVCWLATAVVVSLAIGAGGGGIDGLLAGGIAAVVAGILLLLLTIAALAVTPIAYLVWAARRSGPAAGRTLGQQLLEVRVERADGRPMTARRLIWHGVSLYLTWAVVEVAALGVGGAAHAAAITSLLMLLAIGGAAWMALTDGRLPHDRVSGTVVRFRPVEATPALAAAKDAPLGG